MCHSTQPPIWSRQPQRNDTQKLAVTCGNPRRPRVKLSPSDDSRGAGQKLNGTPPTCGARRIAEGPLSRANEHHEHEVRPDGAASQEAPWQDERHPTPTTLSLHKETPRTTNASCVKCSKSAKATHREQDHDKPCRFKQKFSWKALPTFAPNSSDMP